jgi:hypothetical protein
MDLYRQTLGLLGWVISPVARPLSTQYKTNTEEMRTDIHLSSGIRTHDPSVELAKTFLDLYRAATVIGITLNKVIVHG